MIVRPHLPPLTRLVQPTDGVRPSGMRGDGTNCQADDDGAGSAREVLELSGQWCLTGVVGRDGEFRLKFTPSEWTTDSLTLAPDRTVPIQSGK